MHQESCRVITSFKPFTVCGITEVYQSHCNEHFEERKRVARVGLLYDVPCERCTGRATAPGSSGWLTGKRYDDGSGSGCHHAKCPDELCQFTTWRIGADLGCGKPAVLISGELEHRPFGFGMSQVKALCKQHMGRLKSHNTRTRNRAEKDRLAAIIRTKQVEEELRQLDLNEELIAILQELGLTAEIPWRTGLPGALMMNAADVIAALGVQLPAHLDALRSSNAD